MHTPDDFTEAAYWRLLMLARDRYAFEPFGTGSSEAHVLWRHDVDFSVHRALALARLERQAGLRATYFVMLHSSFYNLLDHEIVERVREIAALGHWIGLHFDAGFYLPCDDERLLRAMRHEAGIIAELVGTPPPIGACSFHDPERLNLLDVNEDIVAGMVNAYGKDLHDRYRYVSDSNGIWRSETLESALIDGVQARLHVLTHPGWWQQQAMPPRARIQRCIDGRARNTAARYDTLLERAGRPNVK